MGHPPGLPGLTLSTGDKSETASVIGVGDPVASPPKIRSSAMIDHISEHVGSLSVLDKPKGITPELKVIPSLINAV